MWLSIVLFAIQGSGIGSIEATQAVIDLCAQHKIYPEIKVVPVWEINRVFEKLDGAAANICENTKLQLKNIIFVICLVFVNIYIF